MKETQSFKVMVSRMNDLNRQVKTNIIQGAQYINYIGKTGDYFAVCFTAGIILFSNLSLSHYNEARYKIVCDHRNNGELPNINSTEEGILLVRQYNKSNNIK